MQITEDVSQHARLVRAITAEMKKVIVGQEYLVERLMVVLLADGHILIEGVPGLAKTTTVKTLAAAIHAKFQRIQFTPDLLPSDLIGTLIFNPKESTYSTKKGPIFANIILADEINRAPAKVQSALLEAMEERQVTIGETTHRLDPLFMIMATQNPIEQDGTYPLPEAQMDRFMLKINITYPTYEEERLVLRTQRSREGGRTAAPVISPADIIGLRSAVDKVYLDEKIEKYILDLVFATRSPGRYKMPDLQPLVQYGASPRATIYLSLAARAYALIKGRDYVVPQDIKAIAPDVMRHRIIPSYEAEAQDVAADDIIGTILQTVEVP